MLNMRKIFNPVKIHLSSLCVADIEVVLPDAAKKIAASRSPQEPIVVITQDVGVEFLAAAKLFLLEGTHDEALPISVADSFALGEEIVNHIEDGWLSDVDGTGRNVKWDREYIPSTKVLMFRAGSPQLAFMRTLIGLADRLEDCESLEGLMATAFWVMPPGEYSRPGDAKIDRETNVLFLHCQSTTKMMSVATMPMRDVVKAALDFMMDIESA